MIRRRLAAIAALALGTAAAVFALVVAVNDFPRPLLVLALALAAVASAWYGLLHRRLRRTVALTVAALLLGGTIAIVLTGSHVLELALIVAGVVGALAAARVAFAVHVSLPAASRPRRPFLFLNPRSGGGKAERFALAAEAERRGIEPIELEPGDDLGKLVDGALARGADALAMAGGDGSQAIVAALAAEHDIPYACIPAGTRNHFALDLGVDRDDVVGALDALVDGGERRIDLGEINGRVFVNNVSLGVYADAVQQAGYRDAKLRTLIDTIPDVLGPDASPPDLRWTAPGDGERRGGAVILISNNPYRLGRALSSGTRPRVDGGTLGVTVFGPREGHGSPWLEWSTSTFEIMSDRRIPAGIDGEATVLEAPLRFRIRCGALRVRIARGHPGASPSALEPDGPWETVKALVRIAVKPKPLSTTVIAATAPDQRR